MTMISASEAFLRQNDSALEGMTPEDRATIENHAEHHAGGLFVVFGYAAADGRCVKVHDDWGDEDDFPVCVNVYDPDEPTDEWVDTYDPDDSRDAVEMYPTMHDALERFRALTT